MCRRVLPPNDDGSDVEIKSKSDNRFQIHRLAHFESVFSAESELLNPRIAKLIRAGTVNPEPDSQECKINPTTFLRVHIENSSCANVAQTLLDLDLELRRASAFVTYGRTRPAGDSHIIEVVSATQTSSILVALQAGKDLYAALTSLPISFLLALDWFWLHRQARMRVRPPNEEVDPSVSWAALVRAASDLVQRNYPVAVAIEVSEDGATTFGFACISNIDDIRR
jgi:hypothetical protein